MLRIEEVSSLNGFYALRKDWTKVLENSADNNIFLTWEMAASCVRNIEKTMEIRVLCIKDADKIVTIAPLRKSRYKMGYQVIEPLNYRLSDYTGFIMTKEEESLKLIINYLFEYKDWDFIYLLDIPETSLIFKFLPKIVLEIPRFELIEGKLCPYITLPSSIELLFSYLNAKFRKNLRRSIRNLKSDYQRIELKRYDEIGSVEDAMNQFFVLHQKRWKTKGQPGVYAEDKTRIASIESAKLYAEKGWLALYFLMINEKPVAAQYCLKYNNKMHYGLGGLDPSYYKYSVGNIITSMMLEKCIEQKIEEYDFMKGDEPYKFEWTNQARRNLGVKFVNNRVSSKLYHFGIKSAKGIKLDRFIGKNMRL